MKNKQKIIEEHGGTLRYLQKPEGGSLFRAAIPIPNLSL